MDLTAEVLAEMRLHLAADLGLDDVLGHVVRHLDEGRLIKDADQVGQLQETKVV